MMSVGGRLVEIKPYMLRDQDNPEFAKNVLRLWVIDRNGDETIVYAELTDHIPKIGDNIWWQSGKILFDQDKYFLNKIGYSHRA
jgi:hypothetical protein